MLYHSNFCQYYHVFIHGKCEPLLLPMFVLHKFCLFISPLLCLRLFRMYLLLLLLCILLPLRILFLILFLRLFLLLRRLLILRIQLLLLTVILNSGKQNQTKERNSQYSLPAPLPPAPSALVPPSHTHSPPASLPSSAPLPAAVPPVPEFRLIVVYHVSYIFYHQQIMLYSLSSSNERKSSVVLQVFCDLASLLRCCLRRR